MDDAEGGRSSPFVPAPGEEAVVHPRHLHSFPPALGPAPAIRARTVRPSARRRPGTATSRQPAGAGHHGEGSTDEDHDGIHQ